MRVKFLSTWWYQGYVKPWRTAVILLLLLVIVAKPALGATTHHDRHTYLVTKHGSYLFYTDQYRNTTEEWNSSYQALSSVRVFVTGNVSYSILDRISGVTVNGTLTEGSVEESLVINGSETWLIVTLWHQANATELIEANLSTNDTLLIPEVFNFGHMGVSVQELVVVRPSQATTVLLLMALKREWWTLFYTAFVVIAVSVPTYLTVTRYKRGKIRER